MHSNPAMLMLYQVARLEQRVFAVSAESEQLSAALDDARAAADRAKAAAAASLDGIGNMPRDKWPRAVTLLVEAAEAAVRDDAHQKLVGQQYTACPA